jgi:hypothetical protein
MDAREEAASLAENPLPETPIIDPLTRVLTIDGEIAALQEQIAALQEQRQAALNFAVKNNITEDTRCRLETKVRKTRTLDVARFREVFPEEAMIAADKERRELEEKMAHIGERINLTLVDSLVGKAKLEAAQGVISIKESVSYGVTLK